MKNIVHSFRKLVVSCLVLSFLPVFSSVSAEDGFVTISPSEAALFTNSTGTPVAAINAGNMNGSGVSAYSYKLTDVKAATDKNRLYLRFDLSSYSTWTVISATLSLNIRMDNSNKSTVKIYSADTITGDLSDITTTYSSDISALEGIAVAQNLVDSFNVRGAGTDSADIYGIKPGKRITRTISDYICGRINGGYDAATLLFEFEGAASSYAVWIAADGSTYEPTLKIEKEVAPTASNVEIKGSNIVGRTVEASYIYSGGTEGETEFEWYVADDAVGTNEAQLPSATTKEFTITSSLQDKYIRFKVTPHTASGQFSKGGTGVCNTYYSSYIGPIKTKQYLDGIVLGMQNLSRSDLEAYISANSSDLDLSLSVDETEMLLDSILAQCPSTYDDFANTVYVIKALNHIKTGTSSDVKDIIEDEALDLNLDNYTQVADKNAIYSNISGRAFASIVDLQKTLDELCIYDIVESSENESAICEVLRNNRTIFTTDLTNTSYGLLLNASTYLFNNKTNYNNFEDINDAIPAAIAFADTNYYGGFVAMKHSFAEAAYVKVDFSTDEYGSVSSASLSGGRYKLMGEKSAQNTKYYTALKVKIDDLPEYKLYSAYINLYGTAGGGANNTLSITETDGFLDQTDFETRYPKGKDIVVGEIISTVHYSYGTTEWQSANITDQVVNAKNSGEKYIYLMLNYENSAGSDESKSGYVYNINHAEYAPYIEFTFETPALVKNVKLDGARAVGSTLKVSYDYYGCYEEGNSIIEWFAADDTLGTNESKVSYVGNDFEITSNLIGKVILAQITPKSKGGQYLVGEVSRSAYTVPIQDATYVNTVITNLNACTTEAELDAVISDSALSLDSSFGGVTGTSNIKQAIINKTFASLDEFTDYYVKMIEVQKINEMTVNSDINTIIENNHFDFNLSRYSAMSETDKDTVINSLKAKNFASVEAFVDAFNEACITKEFANVNYSNINELLTFYDFLLDADYSSLIDSKKTVVDNAFMTYLNSGAGYGISTKALINNTLNAAIAYLATYVPSVNPTSGGSGGSGGGSTGVSISMPSSGGSTGIGSVGGFTPVKNEYVFKDIENVASWAGDQITTLYNKKIISGDGDGNFRPNDNVKREEFVKMIVSAFEISSGDDCEFADAEKEAWYYSYICAAYNSGITSGMGDGNFGIGVNITREDMVVMLYRILIDAGCINDKEYNFNFEDSYEISTYARNAVAAFYNYKIVSGVGDNLFSPKQTATRAMAAVIICNALAVAGIE